VRLSPDVAGTGEEGGDENVVLREEGAFGDETVLLRRTPMVDVRSVVDVFALGAFEPVRDAPCRRAGGGGGGDLAADGNEVESFGRPGFRSGISVEC
jgi:hypothetical protein